MIIPAVMFIEMGKDMLKGRDPAILAAEVKEFNCLGPRRMDQIMESMVASTTDPRAVFYLLGIETARALLVTNVAAAKAGVSI